MDRVERGTNTFGGSWGGRWVFAFIAACQMTARLGLLRISELVSDGHQLSAPRELA